MVDPQHAHDQALCSRVAGAAAAVIGLCQRDLEAFAAYPVRNAIVEEAHQPVVLALSCAERALELAPAAPLEAAGALQDAGDVLPDLWGELGFDSDFVHVVCAAKRLREQREVDEPDDVGEFDLDSQEAFEWSGHRTVRNFVRAGVTPSEATRSTPTAAAARRSPVQWQRRGDSLLFLALMRSADRGRDAANCAARRTADEHRRSMRRTRWWTMFTRDLRSRRRRPCGARAGRHRPRRRRAARSTRAGPRSDDGPGEPAPAREAAR